jgi:hypothetical protein
MEGQIGTDCMDLIYNYVHQLKLTDVINELMTKQYKCVECRKNRLQISWYCCHYCNEGICYYCIPRNLNVNYLQCLNCELYIQRFNYQREYVENILLLLMIMIIFILQLLQVYFMIEREEI